MTDPASNALLVLRKPTGTIQVSNPFSLGEQKLLNALMCHAQSKGLAIGERHEIGLDRLYPALGWSASKNVDRLKDYLRVLLGTVVEWNEFGEDRTRAWNACQFLSQGLIRGRTLSFIINPVIVAELRAPVLYARVELRVQGRMKRHHALVLYELCADAIGRGVRLVLTIERLGAALGLDPGAYPQYKYLRRDVLGPAVAEVNAHSNIEASFERVTERRKTVAVAFDACYRTPPIADAAPPLSLASAVEASVAELVRHGVSPGAAETLCARHSAAAVAANVRLLESAVAGGTRVGNPGAWLRRAIEQGWAKPDDEPPRAHDPASKRESEAVGTAAREAFERHRRQRSREAFAERSKTFRTRRRNAFVAAMQAEGDRTVLDALARHGWDNAMVDACLFAHGTLMDDLLVEPHERDLERFVAWRGRTAKGGRVRRTEREC